MHPQIGADIIASVPFPYPVAPLVLSHHERWDGRGYPMGLKGEEIPLGARILCLVDYFDALTSERPYHKPMSIDAAAALIQEEAGKALDPMAVDAFLRILPELRSKMEAVPTSGPARCRPYRRAAPPPARRVPRRADADVRLRRHRRRAPRDLRALRAGAVDGDDARRHRDDGLIASKLERRGALLGLLAVPLLRGRRHAAVPVRHRHDAELLQQLMLKNGQGLTGWVARNRRPLVNGRPSADFHRRGSSRSRPPWSRRWSARSSPATRDRHARRLPHGAEAFYRDDHRRLLDRVCEQAVRRDPQRDRVRPDAGES